MTETERKVMEILIAHPPTTDAREGSIQDVDEAMKWGTAVSERYVQNMVDRRLVTLKMKTAPPPGLSMCWWERGEAAD